MSAEENLLTFERKVNQSYHQKMDNIFNWKEHCFVCGKQADLRHTERTSFVKVMTLPLRDNLMVCAKERDDERGKAMLGWLESCMHD